MTGISATRRACRHDDAFSKAANVVTAAELTQQTAWCERDEPRAAIGAI